MDACATVFSLQPSCRAQNGHRRRTPPDRPHTVMHTHTPTRSHTPTSTQTRGDKQRHASSSSTHAPTGRSGADHQIPREGVPRRRQAVSVKGTPPPTVPWEGIPAPAERSAGVAGTSDTALWKCVAPGCDPGLALGSRGKLLGEGGEVVVKGRLRWSMRAASGIDGSDD